MAVHRFARITAAADVGPGTRLLSLALPEPLGFVGGQYIIVDTGLVAASGKAVKRAYSLLSADANQLTFELAVKRLPLGPGSAFMHDVPVGAELKLSGPWGKLHPAQGADGATVVLATDTGITAALGLLCSGRFAPLLAHTTFQWLRTASDDFLPDDFVRARLPPGLHSAKIGCLPPVDHPERIAWARALLRELLLPAP